MRTITVTKELYQFDELDESAKQKAINYFRSGNDDFSFLAEYVMEDAKTIGKMLGIKIKDIFYSGFSSQGDGACFTGTYSFTYDAIKNVTQYAPTDTKLKEIAMILDRLQSKVNNTLCASISKNHYVRYHHENSVTIEVYGDETDIPFQVESITDELKDTLRDFMRWIYRSLEREYDYQNSDEGIIESIKENEYEFTKEGNIT